MTRPDMISVSPEALRELSHDIMGYSNQGLLKIDFLPKVARRILEFSACNAVELWVREESQKHYRCAVTDAGDLLFDSRSPATESRDGHDRSSTDRSSAIDEPLEFEELCDQLLGAHHEEGARSVGDRRQGSLWTGDAGKISGSTRMVHGFSQPETCIKGDYRSLAIVPVTIEEKRIGLLLLKKKEAGFFRPETITLYERLARPLGIALAHQYAKIELRERVKELTCLHAIAQLAAQPGATLEEVIGGILDLLPPAWLYPDIASARIELDGRSYTTENHHDSPHRLRSAIIARGHAVGFVEVAYDEMRHELDEGPFLAEERRLIDNVAREIAQIHEHAKAEEDKSQLQDQLRHTDRLATIGQLAAGVAHELNEPLGNILGFAQLIQKGPDLPVQTAKDLDRIISASLHAREIIKKLMAFARQLPPKKVLVDLPRLARDGLYLFEARCAKVGIELVRRFSTDVPMLIADPGQIYQVLVNLVVNGIQAMESGGTLTVAISADDEHVLLTVQDTGTGMSEEVKEQILIPFFTTKDVDEGTGLGLPVVHGIVAAHGGSLHVETEMGIGSRFEVRLPIGAPEGDRGTERDVEV